MRSKIILLISFFLLNNLYGQEQFPAFENITSHFFKTYSLKSNQSYQELRFTKGLAGYYIEEYNYDTKSFNNKKIFWSVDKKAYLTLDFPKNESSIDDISEAYLKYDNNTHRFNNLPYYGYINWQKDVLNLLKNKEELTNYELYALGRTYSSLAADLLSNNSGFANVSTMFPVEEVGQNQLTEKQLKKYRTYINKATDAFEKLCIKNPEYPTLVGSICNKLHNEYTSSFLNLRIFQNEKEALKELPKELYSDFFLDFAKNLLDACEPNAILFTAGDNDTYPLLYLQARKRYRQDVTIINFSLLNNNKYINYIRSNRVFNADSIAMQLFIEAYKGDKLGYATIKPSEEIITLKHALELINKEDEETIDTKYPIYPFIISNQLKINLENEKSITLNIDKQYLSKAEVLLLDIIQANNQKRPIYLKYEIMPILSNYLEMNGINYKLTPQPKNKTDSPYHGGINAENTFLHLTEKLNFKSIENTKEANQVSIILDYQIAFNELIKYYKSKNNKQNAAILIDKYINLFSEKFYGKLKLTNMEIIIDTYQIGLLEQADIMTNRLLKSIKKDLDIIKSKNDERFSISDSKKDSKAEREIEKILYVLGQLKKVMDKTIETSSKITKLQEYAFELSSELTD